MEGANRISKKGVLYIVCVRRIVMCSKAKQTLQTPKCVANARVLWLLVVWTRAMKAMSGYNSQSACTLSGSKLLRGGCLPKPAPRAISMPACGPTPYPCALPRDPRSLPRGTTRDPSLLPSDMGLLPHDRSPCPLYRVRHPMAQLCRAVTPLQ